MRGDVSGWGLCSTEESADACAGLCDSREKLEVQAAGQSKVCRSFEYRLADRKCCRNFSNASRTSRTRSPAARRSAWLYCARRRGAAGRTRREPPPRRSMPAAHAAPSPCAAPPPSWWSGSGYGGVVSGSGSGYSGVVTAAGTVPCAPSAASFVTVSCGGAAQPACMKSTPGQPPPLAYVTASCGQSGAVPCAAAQPLPAAAQQPCVAGPRSSCTGGAVIAVAPLPAAAQQPCVAAGPSSSCAGGPVVAVPCGQALSGCGAHAPQVQLSAPVAYRPVAAPATAMAAARADFASAVAMQSSSIRRNTG